MKEERKELLAIKARRSARIYSHIKWSPVLRIIKTSVDGDDALIWVAESIGSKHQTQQLIMELNVPELKELFALQSELKEARKEIVVTTTSYDEHGNQSYHDTFGQPDKLTIAQLEKKLKDFATFTIPEEK